MIGPSASFVRAPDVRLVTAQLALSLYVERVGEVRLMSWYADEPFERSHALQHGAACSARRASRTSRRTRCLRVVLDWNDQVREGVRWVLDKLKDYDLATLQVSPEDDATS